MRRRRPDDVPRALVRLNAHVLGAALALLAAAGLFAATAILVLEGGESPGPLLARLRLFFPGYEVSLSGALIGALWAGAAGYLAGLALGLAYGPWLLRQAVRAMDSPPDDGELGHDVALLQALPFAVATGALAAAGLFAATNWLWLRYGFPSPKLALLSNYLPGYTTDFWGSLIGAAWMFVYGFVAAGSIAWIYDRIVVRRTTRS